MTFECRQPMTAPPLVDCPECEGHVRRLIQPVGVVFKGSGFYCTDNKSSRKSGGSEEKVETKTSSESVDSKESKESKGSTKGSSESASKSAA
jgi:putative FmdB family regulatory protein